MDELFEAKLWAWQFKRYETHGTGRTLATLENEGQVYSGKEIADIQDHDLPLAETKVC